MAKKSKPPAQQEKYAKVSALLKQWQAALQSDTFRQALEKAKAEWKAQTGRPDPGIDLDEWAALAAEAGIDANRILDGKWTLAEFEPIIRGYLRRKQQDQAATKNAGPWSKPDSPKCWATTFGFSADTFIRRCEDGTIRSKKLTDRSYQVHIADLPAPQSSAEHRQK